MDSCESIQHWFHEHPLGRVDPTADDWRLNWCYGCWRDFLAGEAVYGCCSDNCRFVGALHQECAEMAREIRHPAHPSHPLKQVVSYDGVTRIGSQSGCAVCEELCTLGRLIYICSRGCEWWIHLGCAGGADQNERQSKVMKHPSHPQHQLQFLRGKKRSCSFQCDACGAMEKGNSYICTTCDFWIHETCAALPLTQDFPRHHPHHSLSLAFHTPYEYIQYEFECAVCGGGMRITQWVYHCHLCRYVVHIKCATKASPKINNEIIAADDHKDIIKLPINDMYEEIIRPFVKKQSKGFFIPSDEPEAEDKNIISGKYKFHNHHHPLNFTTFGLSSSHDDDGDDDDDDDVDDDDGDYNIPRLASVLICDACTLPIHQKSSGTSSSSCCSYEYDDSGYMFCGECDYFLHLACFNLPPKLSSHPLHPKKDHKLTLLQKSNKLKDWSFCNFCHLRTNGLFYACTECDFKLDIKCASLPDTMKHAGHARPHHFLKLVAGSHRSSLCGACYTYLYGKRYRYSCDSCKFLMCLECVFLLASNKHRLEKHRLSLTYDASVNHPSEFYCGSCEEKMHPRMWMYHCRDCDQSFHPKCFPATSGRYRNINFGRHEYNMNVTTIYHHPHHPLKFQIITKKKHCDLCPRHVYEEPGFQCAACNFVSCTKEHPNVSITIINSQ